MADTVTTAIYKMGVEGQQQVDAAGASVDRLAVSEEKLTRATRTSADSVDRLLGRLDPRIRAEQQLQAALAQVNRFEEEGVGTAASRAQAINAATTRYSEAITRLNGTAAANTFLGAGNAAKLSAFQIQNLSFQMQDVGQAVATGQPLFRTLIQQGSQIAQTFGPGVGVAGALRAVGTAVGSFLLNPLNLAVLGFAAAAGAAQLLFGFIKNGGASAEEELKKHKELIDRIVEAYGGAGRAATSFAKESATALHFATTQALAEEQARLQSALSGFAAGVTGGRQQSLIGFSGEDADKARSAISKFIAEIRAGGGNVMDFREGLNQLGDASDDPRFRAMIQTWLNNTKALADLAAQAGQTAGAVSLLAGVHLGPSGKLTSQFDVGFGETAGAMDKLRRDLAALHPKEATAKSGISEAERQAKAIQDVKDALAFEAAQLGRTSEEQAVYNRLKAAGVDILSQDGMEIAASTRKLFEQEAALKKQIASMDQVRDVAKDVLSGFIGDLNQGKTAVEALAGAFGKLGDKLLDLAAQDLIDQIFGKSGTQGSGGIWNVLGSLFGIGGGAGVGNVTMGGLYHSGGVVGSSSVPGRYVHPAYFDNAPRLHEGLRADEFPAILQRGETVIPRGASSGASSNIQMGDIHIHTEGSSGDPVADAKQARAVAETVRGVVREEIFKATKVGGQLNRIP